MVLLVVDSSTDMFNIFLANCDSAGLGTEANIAASVHCEGRCMSHSNTVATTASTELQGWRLSEPGGNVAPSSNPQARNLGKEAKSSEKTAVPKTQKRQNASGSSDKPAKRSKAAKAAAPKGKAAQA